MATFSPYIPNTTLNYTPISNWVPMFNGKNYKHWSIQMKTLLKAHNLWDLVENGYGFGYEQYGDISDQSPWEVINIARQLEETLRRELEETLRRDQGALSYIHRGVDAAIFPKIEGATSAKEAWDILSKVSQNTCTEEAVIIQEHVPLIRAAFTGNWKKALEILRNNPKPLTTQITTDGDIFLSVAVSICDDKRVLRKLVDLIDEEDLHKLDYDMLDSTMAQTGNITAAKFLLEECPELNRGPMLVTEAIEHGQKELATYYLSRLNAYDQLIDNYPNFLLIVDATIKGDLFGQAHHILKARIEMTRMLLEDRDVVCGVVEYLARKPQAFRRGSKLGVFEWLICRCISVNMEGKLSHDTKGLTKGTLHVKQSRWKFILQILGKKAKNIRDTKLMHLYAKEMLELFCKPIETDNGNDYEKFVRRAALIAAECGNYEVLVKLVRLYPSAVAINDENGRNIFHYAVSLRHAKIVSLLYQLGPYRNDLTRRTDNSGHNTLHYAAKLPASNTWLGTEAVLKMQREIQWFQVVESLTVPVARQCELEMDGVNLTSRELFTKEHKVLKKEGEEMVKNTAQSGTVVAALIATMAFAVAFTVPGGNNQETGIPIFLGTPAFMLFAICDAMAFFSSITSAMAFTVILTSSTSEEDFVFSLPLKLIIGLVSLSISAACTMVAFCATLHIGLSQKLKLIVVPIAIPAVIPVAFFVSMQLPFLVELTKTTFGKAHLPSPDKSSLMMQRQSGFVGKLKEWFNRAINSVLISKKNQPKVSV